MTDHIARLHSGFRGGVIACVVAALVSVACAATASASEVVIQDDVLLVTDSSGDANAIDVRRALGTYEVYDDRAPLTASGLECVPKGVHHVTCMVMMELRKVVVDGGIGNDIIEVGDVGVPVEATGGEGDDLIAGGRAGDDLAGEAGDDTVLGGSGNDTISGRDGGDLLLGGTGGDDMSGGDGADIMEGGAGNGDLLKGEGGRDLLKGGDGNDTLVGGDDSDAIVTGKGDDTVNTGIGDDVVFATTSDTVHCGPDGAQVKIEGVVPQGCQALPATDTKPGSWPPPAGASGAETPSTGGHITRAAFAGSVPFNKRFPAAPLSGKAVKNLVVYIRVRETRVVGARVIIYPAKGKRYSFRVSIYIGKKWRIAVEKPPKGRVKRAVVVCCTQKR